MRRILAVVAEGGDPDLLWEDSEEEVDGEAL